MLRATILNNFLLILLLLKPFTVFAEDFVIKGLLKSLSTIDSYCASSIIDLVGDESAMVQERVVGRIIVNSAVAENTTLHVHYENSFSKGEYLSAVDALNGRTGHIDMLNADSPSDRSQVFSLTQEYLDDNGELAYHRLDRLYVEYVLDDMNIRIGRQALTWGGGKAFNPLDIMNPFSPTDTIRDYKNGTDMIAIQTYSKMFADVQGVLVPRRGDDSGELEYEESSAALKLRNTFIETDAEVLFGWHYGEPFAGGGISVFIGEAALRIDALASKGKHKDSFSAVSNIDYSWLFLGKNIYGYFELYYNSLGKGSIDDVLADRELFERIARGEMYLRDRYYASAGVVYELHPLINLNMSFIYNILDSSYVLQPRVEWDIRENMRILAGIDLPEGNLGSEFGGFYDNRGGGVISPAKRIYGQVVLYF